MYNIFFPNQMTSKIIQPSVLQFTQHLIKDVLKGIDNQYSINLFQCFTIQESCLDCFYQLKAHLPLQQIVKSSNLCFTFFYILFDISQNQEQTQQEYKASAQLKGPGRDKLRGTFCTPVTIQQGLSALITTHLAMHSFEVECVIAMM